MAVALPAACTDMKCGLAHCRMPRSSFRTLRTEITGTRYNRTRSELDWIAYKIAASMKREPLVKRTGPCWDYT